MIDNPMNLTGKKYLITGASSGIGRAAAILVSKLGGHIVLNGRNEDRLNETLALLSGEGHFCMPFDLTNCEGAKQYIKDCVALDGARFDGMVYSTGTMGIGNVQGIPIRSETMNRLESMMQVNFYTFFGLIKEFSSKRVLNDGSSIVAVTSSCVLGPQKSQMAYASGKAAVEMTCKVAAQEFLGRKIRVNTIQPHITDTPMTNSFVREKTKEAMEKFQPLGILEPMDVANAIAFFLSDLSNKITGQSIYLSAGCYGSSVDFYGLSE